MEGNEHLNKVTQVRYIVVDEADRMIEKGHFQELTELFQLINNNEYVLLHSKHIFNLVRESRKSGSRDLDQAPFVPEI